jgi:hypothetical protein
VWVSGTWWFLGDLLRNENVAKSLAAWLESLKIKNEAAKNPCPYYASLLFGLLMFAGIVLLAWFKILDSQATVVLIGALIAAWYGGQRQRPQS